MLLVIWSQCFSLAKPLTHQLGGSAHSPQILSQRQSPKYVQDHNECEKGLPHLEFYGGGKVWLVSFSMVLTVPGRHGAIAFKVPPGLGSPAANPHHPSPGEDRYITYGNYVRSKHDEMNAQTMNQVCCSSDTSLCWSAP